MKAKVAWSEVEKRGHGRARTRHTVILDYDEARALLARLKANPRCTIHGFQVLVYFKGLEEKLNGDNNE